jgi:two-component system response regulator DesR
VILTVLGRPGQLREALNAHVSGFMVKDAPSDQLIDVLRRVAAGERVIDQKLALATLEMKESPLSDRETDVLRRFAAGADLPEIAAELFLSYGTVRNYMASVVTKLGGRNRMDAVRIAAEAGWL